MKCHVTILMRLIILLDLFASSHVVHKNVLITFATFHVIVIATERGVLLNRALYCCLLKNNGFIVLKYTAFLTVHVLTFSCYAVFLILYLESVNTLDNLKDLLS